METRTDTDLERRALELLESALERPTRERGIFLRERCGSDEDLYRKVTSLLGPGEDPGPFDEPLFPPSTPELAAGESVGPYRVERRLGKGGMGAVYLAERSDGEFRQRVAVKVLRRHLAGSAEARHRFLIEKQIQADLGRDTPYIAGILDAGETEGGLPYFLLDYFDGKPVQRYCEAEGLSTNQRVDLFCEVCEAVELAHQRGVIHRDLKPGNILVTEEGPRLLDFGIAKLLGPTDPVLEPWEDHGQSPLTLAYASPEQHAGASITVASDVYSLGVILHEILTGRRPPDGPSFHELPTERLIPGAGAKGKVGNGRGKTTEVPLSLPQDFSEDLRAILRQALQLRPEERYWSAAQLAEDLRRYRGGLPILARRKERLYLVGRFLRRRWREVGTALVVLGLAGGFLLSQVKATSEQSARNQMAEFLMDLFKKADPHRRGGDQAVKEFFDDTANSVDRILEGLPEQAAYSGQLGLAYLRWGLYREAKVLLERSLELRREQLAPESELALSFNNLARGLKESGDLEGARWAVQEALEISRRNGGPGSENFALDLTAVAHVDKALGDFGAAIEGLERALGVFRALHGAGDHPDVAIALNNLGNALRQQGRPEEARPLLEEALAMLRRLSGRPLAVTYPLQNLGALHCDRGLRDPGAAELGERLLRENLELRRSLYSDPRHPRIAKALRELGSCLRVRGEVATAAEFLNEALSIQKERLALDHLEVGKTLREQAVLWTDLGRPVEAERSALRAREIFRAALPAGHWRLADIRSVLGGSLLALGRLEEAFEALQAGHEELSGKLGEGAREALEARARLRNFSENSR